MATPLRRKLLTNPRIQQTWICNSCRYISSGPILQSGHNRWSTIRHDKGKNDAAKSKERQIFSKDIIQASKLYGPDPKSNPRLALVIANAKRSGMPKPTIEAAIARGQGITAAGAALESLTIEGMLPHSVAVVVECLTDQKARALQDIRAIIRHSGGSNTPTSYLFEKKGKIVFEPKPGLDVDSYLELAIDAGATDVEGDENNRLIVYTEHTATKSVADKMSATTDLVTESIDIIWDPNQDTLVKIESEEALSTVENIINSLRDDPSVQDIYVNCPDIST
ncbi:hypothetical protein McanMca71_002194 [Microsporum canis]|uniref:DUF28 domain-containing protein n=1 Tax=Arthroderma otae (strain ATCC MYA-4605 / CBS 113480) TaxID=554155 RepID=C5FKT8_ARTOC|nr:conserved hypothetical protein [Microsporum canis CBS 113480]EEQ30310.1 conserved hypothetical protein [Microsporum canis CBS 113480]